MSTLTKFTKSFSRWTKCEKCFMRYLTSYPGVISIEQSHGHFPDWDIKMTYENDWKIKEATYEVKSDRLSEQTWNFCIEYYNTKKGWPSGITTSKADYYVYYADGKWWIAKRPELLVKLIWQCFTDIRDGGNDNSRMIILPVGQLPEYFEELPEITEIPE